MVRNIFINFKNYYQMFKNGLTIITVGKYVQYWPCINLFILIERFRVPFRISQNRKHATKSSSKQLFE